jgi:hypothetical protein
MLDRAIGILGIALALFFGAWSLAPEGWPKMPPWAIYLGVATGIFLVGIAGGMIVSEYRKDDSVIANFAKWPEPYRPISVVGKVFRNERVALDGKFYSRCTFENVTFVYNGTTTIQFSDNKVVGSVWYASDNPAVLGTLGWMRGFGAIKDGIIVDAGTNIIEVPKIIQDR